MIGSLRGMLLDRHARGEHAAELLIEVGGVGYRVVAPAPVAARLGDVGRPVFVHVHTHVREDAIVLYGFATGEERTCFEALIGAHGVGPAVALAMLSVHSPVALRRAVAADDLDALSLVPGIGKKTAARLVVELKARLDLDDDGPGLALVGSGAEASGADDTARRRGEVRAALAALGYGPEEIRAALTRLPAAGDVEDMVRAALRNLATAVRQ